MSDLEKAIRFAEEKHRGQFRKNTKILYIIHPLNVMSTVIGYYTINDLSMCMAAVLHDVVEDCDVTLEDIKSAFGVHVSTLVGHLTDFNPQPKAPRHVRKTLYNKQLADAPFRAQYIKVADIKDNIKDVVDVDHKFAKLYLKEKLQTLSIMCLDIKETQLYTDTIELIHRQQTELGD